MTASPQHLRLVNGTFQNDVQSYVQSGGGPLNADASSSSTAYVDLFSRTFTKALAGSVLNIWSHVVIGKVGLTVVTAAIKVSIDGVQVSNDAGLTLDVGDSINQDRNVAAMFYQVAGISAALHTLTVAWKVLIGPGTLLCNPITAADRYSTSLVIQETLS